MPAKYDRAKSYIVPVVVYDAIVSWIENQAAAFTTPEMLPLSLTRDDLVAMFWPPEHRHAHETVAHAFQQQVARATGLSIELGDRTVSVATLTFDPAKCPTKMPAPLLPSRLYDNSSLDRCPWLERCDAAREAFEKVRAWAEDVALVHAHVSNTLGVFRWLARRADDLRQIRGYLPCLPTLAKLAAGSDQYTHHAECIKFSARVQDYVAPTHMLKIPDMFRERCQIASGWAAQCYVLSQVPMDQAAAKHAAIAVGMKVSTTCSSAEGFAAFGVAQMAAIQASRL